MIASRALMTLSCDRRCARYRRAIPLLPSARDILMRTPSTGILRVGSRSFGEQIISATPYQKAGILVIVWFLKEMNQAVVVRCRDRRIRVM